MSEVMVQMDEFCASVRDGTHDTPKPQLSGKFLVTSRAIRDNRVDYSECYCISESDAEKINKRSGVDQWDVLMTMIGTVGRLLLVKDKPDYSIKNIALFKIGDEWRAKWLYYYLSEQSVQRYFEMIASGTSQHFIGLGHLRKLKIRGFYCDSRKIAKVLSAYDDLIENNTKRIRILERMAEGLYRQMFEYGGRSNAARVGQVKDWFEVTIGRTPPRKNQEYFSTESTDQKWVSIKDMRASGMFVFDTAEKLTPAGVDASKIHISPAGSILLSFKLTVGLVSIAATSVATNEAIAHFETNDRALRDYTYFYLKRFKYGTLGSTSSIANAINSEIVRKMPFVLPVRDTLLKYERAVGPMFDYIAILARQNALLARQRDLLLPRLISGKLSVEGVG